MPIHITLMLSVINKIHFLIVFKLVYWLVVKLINSAGFVDYPFQFSHTAKYSFSTFAVKVN